MSSKIFSPEFLAEHRKSEKDFTRDRSLTFPRLISFMLNMVNGSIQSELSRFFQVLDDSPVALTNVTAAAFCKARKKLSYTAFKDLNANLIHTFYQSRNVQRWRGFRLLAVDGSVTQLPSSPELHSHFGKARAHSIRPAIRMSQLYDIKNQLTVDLQVNSHSTGERNMALQHLEQSNDKDLILYDRGYPAVWFFKVHMQLGINFCARAVVDSSNEIKAFVKSGKRDAVVEFRCVEKSLRRCKKDGLPTAPIKLRLIKITLTTGETEILMSSLFSNKDYPYSIFSDLYHQRWSVEEDYKIMKSRLNIENFSGKSVEAVLQDIHAKTLSKNIAAVAISEAKVLTVERCKTRKSKYKVNFTHALCQLKDNIVRFLMRVARSDLSKLLIEAIATSLNAYRPGRSCQRIKDKRNRPNKYPMAYKRLC